MINPLIETPLENLKRCADDLSASGIEHTERTLDKGQDIVKNHRVPLIIGALVIGVAALLLLPKPERSHRGVTLTTHWTS